MDVVSSESWFSLGPEKSSTGQAFSLDTRPWLSCLRELGIPASPSEGCKRSGEPSVSPPLSTPAAVHGVTTNRHHAPNSSCHNTTVKQILLPDLFCGRESSMKQMIHFAGIQFEGQETAAAALSSPSQCTDPPFGRGGITGGC